VNPAAHSTLASALLAARSEQAAAPAPLLALTTGLAGGDDACWSQFHREFGPGIFRQLLAATRGDHDLATEALQQTYLRVARHARPVDAAPMFHAWLRLVARTALSDCRRRRQSLWSLLQRRYADPTDVTHAAAAADEDRLQLALDAALAQLTPDDRALLEAKYFHGLEVRRIAEQLAVTPKAVESRLTRARAALRELLVSTLRRHE
jgi:RNA polymerase sigma factor (sigma-70 family)